MPIHRALNENFFGKWSPKMAYILGYFAADGNLTVGKRGNHYIEFTSCDRPFLREIRNALGSTHRISICKRDVLNWKPYHRLQIGSIRIFDDLQRLGFTPRKSKTVRFPYVPANFLSHFVRGYFDGDGGVSISTYRREGRSRKSTTILTHFTSGSMKFLRRLHTELKRHAEVSGGSLYYHQGYRLCFSVRDSYSLFKFMYQHAALSLFLHRKRRLFEKYFKIT